MGLDQYVQLCKSEEAPAADVDFDAPEGAGELHYWRKHPNMHGWMAKLYKRKGGQEDEHEFCTAVKLTRADLLELKQVVMDKKLPTTRGFFFGEDENSDEEMDGDLDFIATAMRALEAGYVVFYTSSW